MTYMNNQDRYMGKGADADYMRTPGPAKDPVKQLHDKIIMAAHRIIALEAKVKELETRLNEVEVSQ